MNPVDVHPEDLLDAERAGRLSIDGQARLEAHAARCAPCAMLRHAARDFDAERRSAPGDGALSDRAIAAALGSVSLLAAASGRHKSYFAPRPRRRRRVWAAAAATILFAATGATASFWSVPRSIVSHLLVQAPWRAPRPAAEAKIAAAPSKTATSVPAVDPIVHVPEVVFAPVPHVAKPAPIAATARPRVVEEVAPISADQLFASANEARRHGDSTQAVKLYRQLQQQFAGTREETTSRVLLGRLLLDRGEDIGQSLTLFTRYLADTPNGTLAEEARLGRALALERLGRAYEERQAWQELLTYHPGSIHAERARKRLDELR
jgi:TolA-binding protein